MVFLKRVYNLFFQKHIYMSSSTSQNLYYHSLAVSRIAVHKANLLGVDKTIIDLVEKAALLHDIGKSVSSFQGFLNGKETEASPYHHEIGWAFLRESGQFDSKILNAVYWHHARPLDEKFDHLENVGSILEKLSDQDIESLRDICKQLGFKITKSKNNYDVSVPTLYIKDSNGNSDDNSILLAVRGCLIAADRTISKMSPKQVEDIALGSSLDNYEELKDKSASSITLDISVIDGYDPKRFKIQKDCLELALKNKTTAIKAPSGFGKTLLGTLFSLRSGRKTFWVCPRNVIAETVYKNIIQEINAMKLDKNPSIELFLTGVRKESSDNAPAEPFTSDIVVTNIDNLLKPTVSNDVADKLFMCLYSNVVFDEYHEFVSDSPMFSAFVYFMRFRHRIAKRPQTLLESATDPYIEYLWDTINNKTLILPSSDNHYPAAHTKPYLVSINKGVGSIPPGGLLIRNSIKNAQDCSISYGADILLHSKYTDEDRFLIMKEIYDNFGKGGTGVRDGLKTCSAPVIQASLDVSFSFLCETILSPESTLQRIGRINRWGEQDGLIELVLLESEDKDKSEMGAIRTLYDQKLMGHWVNFLKKEFPSPKSITLDELYKIYNSFNKQNYKIVVSYLLNSHLAGSEILMEKCYPVKVPHLETKKSTKSLRNPDGSFYYTVKDSMTKKWLDTPLSCNYFDVESMLKNNIDRTTSSWIHVLKEMVASGYESYQRFLNLLVKNKGVFTDKRLRLICRNEETPYPDGSRHYHRSGLGKTFKDVGRGIE